MFPRVLRAPDDASTEARFSDGPGMEMVCITIKRQEYLLSVYSLSHL